MVKSPSPRYDRVVSLVFVVLIGLAIVFLVDLNPDTLRLRLGADLPIIPISWILMISLAVITSAGADLLARAHPQMQTRSLPTIGIGPFQLEVVPGFWILPTFSVVGSFAFFRLFSGVLEGAAFVIALLAAGGSLLAVLVCQHYALDRDQKLSQRAQAVLYILAFLFAFGCFSAIYYARLRTLYSATLIGATGALLAYAVLLWTNRPRLLGLALLIGVLLGEATWALNYWSATFLLVGTVLLVIFYTTTGLLQHYVTGRLQARLIAEYGLLGGGLMAAAIYASFQI